MKFSNLFLLSVLSPLVFGSIIPVQERDGDLVVRQRTTSSTKTSTSKTSTSTSKKSTSTSKTSSTSTKASSTSSSVGSGTTTKSSSSSVPPSTVSSSSSSTSAISSLIADPACTNSAFTRACWGNGFSIATDFDTKHPNTGVTRKYNLEITNTTMAPDGFSRLVMAINGQYPGPTLYADWGDMIEVTVKNSLQHNGTGIHWHGIRQLNTNTEDGAPGITECPLAPGDTKTYLFQATQFGTTWYHSHFSSQYGDGVVGALIINGPATTNYDIDLGSYTINDWYYKTTFQLESIIGRSATGPPPSDNVLINGSMVSPSGSGGKYTTNTITAGKKYRLRIINTSVDNHYQVSLDNHLLTVITSDFVPIKPYQASWIFVGIGQRYDVVFTANQTVGSYWFRAEVQDQAGCGASNNNGNIKSIFTYSGAASTTPSSTATPYTQRCTDETGLIPFWDSFVPSGPLSGNVDILNVAINIGVTTSGPVVTWGINLTAIDVQWEKPILQYVLEGNNSWPQSENLIELTKANEWYYWIIQEVPGVVNGNPVSIDVPHPIHLHGHDFYILGTGTGQFNQTNDAPGLDYDNPARRDVAMLPAGGWLALAFQTDNPGAWLMHCHIAWHVSEGLAVQFLETKEKINTVNPISPALTNTCQKWNAYYPSQAVYLKQDSGL